jgi:Mn-dependent DtxR family transcriptional regulator
MTDLNPPLAANMSQRAVMQYLSLTDWKLASRLPVSAGTGMLNRILELGWIELRGAEPRTEIRLTPLGREAMRAPV